VPSFSIFTPLIWNNDTRKLGNILRKLSCTDISGFPDVIWFRYSPVLASGKHVDKLLDSLQDTIFFFFCVIRSAPFSSTNFFYHIIDSFLLIQDRVTWKQLCDSMRQ
jgi:hypothetical protein